jgi:hypothetical protein
MDKEKIIKEYVLNNYKRTFVKKIVIRDAKGQIVKRTYLDLEPIITIKENHIEVKNHKDGSPIILGKNIIK